jgi:sulfoxide reductase heme-binding subunit YedZ
MDDTLSMILKSKALNGWGLLSLITIPICLAVVVTMTRADLSMAEDVSSMIQISVRCSVPWLYLAFAASSIHVLLPSSPSRWLMRNRRILGLCFAAGMA